MNTQTMTPAVYESKRNDLIALLESILESTEDLSETARKDLEEARNKLTRNSFEIVLVGEFQGGKSTTFDTICDGREISPRGQGIKTSACKISAQSIPETESERAELRWKTDDELILTMIGFLRSNLANDKMALELFSQKDEHGADKFPSLSDSRVRKLAEQAIHSEWERYLESPRYYDSDNKGLLDLLKISTLILKFYGTPELEALRSKTTIPVDELKSLVVFPRDWEERWTNGNESAEWWFKEIPFAFLGSVSCYIHCKNLERLGCVITDCPGLFAGPWDTRVAHEAMYHGAAILYLIAGDKAIKESDLRAITEIMKTQQGHKVFFAINARQPKAIVANAYRPVDFAQIKQRGYNLDKAESIDVFNALLAFAGKSGQTENIEVDTAVETYFSLSPRRNDADRERANELQGNPILLYKESDFPAILAKIETDIITKKFESILVKDGTNRASAALNKLAEDLQAKENAAKKSKDEVEKEVELARKQLEDFQLFVTDEVQKEFENPSGANLVANDFAQTVFVNNIEEIANVICSVIAQSSFDNEDIRNEIKQVIRREQSEYPKLQEAISASTLEIMQTSIEGWLANVQQGANDTFRNVYTNALTNLDRRFHEKWEQLVRDDSTGLLKGFAIPEGGDFANLKQVTVGVSADLQAILKKARLLDMILLTIVSIISGVLFVVLCSGPVGAAILAILAVISYCAGVEQLKAALGRMLRPKIVEELHKQTPDIVASLQGQFKVNILKDILAGFIQGYRDSLKEQLAGFENRVKETLADKQKAQDQQDRIAEWAKNVREGQIDPARMEIAQFHKELEPYFK